MSVEVDKSAAAQLPGTWGLPRSVKLERIPGQSLGISIVGRCLLHIMLTVLRLLYTSGAHLCL